MKVSLSTQNVYFTRKPTQNEKIKGRKAIQEGLRELDKKNVSMIIPQTSFPTGKKDDVGIGSPYSDSGKEFSKNIAWWGFNTQQYLPTARLEEGNPVPYVGSVFSSNDLIIDLKALTTDAWGGILDKEVYQSIVDKKPQSEAVSVQKSYDPESPDYNKMVDKTLSGDNVIFYNYAWDNFDPALKNAFSNLKKGKDADPKLKEIYSRFEAFSNDPKNSYWLEKDSLYYGLAEKYGIVFYPYWQGEKAEIDKNLFNRDVVSEKTYKERMAEINADAGLKDKIDFYKFKQFILSEQNKDYNAYCAKTGAEIARVINEANSDDFTIKSLEDCSSGLGNSQKWGFPEIFVKGWTVGCKPDGNWQYKLIDFKKLYNPDGSFAPTGEFLYNKFAKAFKENRGGMRIDHAQGYINPQVTPEGKSITDEKSGRLRTSANGEAIFNKYLVFDEDRLGIDKIKPEQLDELGAVFDIILKAARDNGIPKENLMFEAFDATSRVTDALLAKKELGKIALARWDTGFFNSNDWATLGNHDNDSLREWTDRLFKGENLYGTLSDYTNHLKNELALTDKEVASITDNKDIEQAKKNFIKYQFVKLFASKAQNVQVFFMDFFGEQGRYQKPNVPDPGNWRIKVPSDYEDKYYENLARDLGLNMPEIISLAIVHRARKDGKELPRELLNQLNEYSNILKE